MANKTMIIPAALVSYQSLKDRTLKLVFETNEPTPEDLGNIAMNSQKFGFLAFQEDKYTNEQRQIIEDLESSYEDKGKSKSKRLRDVLFVYCKQNPKGYEVFDDFYNYHMEQFINHVKNQLEP